MKWGNFRHDFYYLQENQSTPEGLPDSEPLNNTNLQMKHRYSVSAAYIP